jgi:hypothetical protein
MRVTRDFLALLQANLLGGEVASLRTAGGQLLQFCLLRQSIHCCCLRVSLEIDVLISAGVISFAVYWPATGLSEFRHFELRF